MHWIKPYVLLLKWWLFKWRWYHHDKEEIAPPDLCILILRYYIQALQEEETRVKLPTLFDMALRANKRVQIHDVTLARYESYKKAGDFRVVSVASSSSSCCDYKELFCQYFLPNLIVDHGAPTRYLILNLLVLVACNRGGSSKKGKLLPSPLSVKNRHILSTLASLAIRIRYGEAVWFCLEHMKYLVTPAGSILGPEMTGLLLQYLYSLEQSAISIITIHHHCYESRAVHLFRHIIWMLLRRESYKEAIDAIWFMIEKLGVLTPLHYVSNCSLLYPREYLTMLKRLKNDDKSIYLVKQVIS